MATSLTFSTVEQLEKYLTKEFKQVLNKEVLPVIKEQELQRIQTNVYDKYEPKYYVRRNNSKGLADPENIIGKYTMVDSTALLEVQNITKANQYIEVKRKNKKSGEISIKRTFSKNRGRYLVDLISMGGHSSYDFSGVSRTKEGKKVGKNLSYYQPRPFIHATVADLKQSDKITSAFKRGLINRGFKIV